MNLLLLFLIFNKILGFKDLWQSYTLDTWLNLERKTEWKKIFVLVVSRSYWGKYIFQYRVRWSSLSYEPIWQEIFHLQENFADTNYFLCFKFPTVGGKWGQLKIKAWNGFLLVRGLRSEPMSESVISKRFLLEVFKFTGNSFSIALWSIMFMM